MTDPLAVIAQLPGVPEAVEEARKAVDRLYRHRVLRRRSPEVSAETALRGARASAALSGVDVDLTPLRAGEIDDPTVQGALRASAEIGRLGSTWRTAPRQVLARLHTVAAHGLAPESSLGRPRQDEALATRLDGLVSLITTGTKTPALVLASVVHAELAVLDLFGTADGVVARAAERLTLVEFGLDPKSLVPSEIGHLSLDYSAALKSYTTGTPTGVATWLRHCAEAVILGVRETTAICEAMQRG
ncbi:oxidoreductase [Nonomuraea sp. NPDC050328]|uniref:oxidoreductase n=1 Tax=Nonomuraea sp. NPDC050328 TaxID=3364361 RepID=UPI0037B1D049